MYKRILLAYDGSEEGRRALFECSDLAMLLKSEVRLLAVIPSYAGMTVVEGMVIQDTFEDEKKHYQGVLDEGLSLLKARGYEVQGSLAYGDPVDEVVAHAKTTGADLICVGHKRAASWAERWWKSSVGKSLIDQAQCSVLIAMTP
jgi:nucleotide-binding universal stress UspA family protein